MGADHEHGAPHKGACTVRVEAPVGVDPLLVAQALVGDGWLLKAERAAPARNPFREHAALAALWDEAAAQYRAQFVRIFDAVNARAEEFISGEIEKARVVRPLFKPDQIRELAQIIRDGHTALAIGMLGEEVATKDEIARLVKLGILPKSASKIIDDAFSYGMLLTEIRTQVARGTARIDKVTLDAMRARLKERPTPLTPHEEAAASAARQHAATYVRGLGNKVADDFTTRAIEADKGLRRKFGAMIAETVSEGAERRNAWRKIKSEMGHKSGDWARDFERIAATEKQRAVQEGYATRLREREGEDALVAKVPTPSACEHCVRLHLTDGAGSRPRVFRLSDLEANGTNVGRKAGAWRAVVGPTHPWCFPAGTLVRTARGDVPIERVRVGDRVWTHLARWRSVERLSQRVLRGEMVELAVGEKTLRLSPEHPLLTDRGWLRADEIAKGDSVMHAPHVAAARLVDTSDAPSEQREEGFLTSILRTLARSRVPGAIDLDREQEIGVREVGVELRDGVAGYGVGKELAEAAFEIGDELLTVARAGLRAADALFDGARLATDCFVCGAHLGTTSALTHLRSARDPRLTASASLYSGAFEAQADHAARHAEAASECEFGFASGVGADDRSLVEFDAEHVAYYGVIVTSVKRARADETVYNFAVSEDESYTLASGVVSHNCECALVHVPPGWGFDKNGDLVPTRARKSWTLAEDLRKAMTFGDSVPEHGITVRIGDPEKAAIVEEVISRTPRALFTKKTGVTLITNDHPSEQSHLDAHDYAYWTGNEIRVLASTPKERLKRIIEHEMGHALNVHLATALGSVDAVRKWHDKLYAMSKREGFVSDYASKSPIENAAEVTRLYLYARGALIQRCPRQFAFCHRAYRALLRDRLLGREPEALAVEAAAAAPEVGDAAP